MSVFRLQTMTNRVGLVKGFVVDDPYAAGADPSRIKMVIKSK